MCIVSILQVSCNLDDNRGVGVVYNTLCWEIDEEHALLTQWEIVCNWLHTMLVEPIKYKSNFK